MRIRWTGHAVCMGEAKCIKKLLENLKRSLGRHKHRLDDNIKIGSKQTDMRVLSGFRCLKVESNDDLL
jgi:hypothetical protein